MRAETATKTDVRALAERLGLPKIELLVLAEANDPYSAATTPARLNAAHWFADLFGRSGRARAHLRRVHYYAVSIEAKLPDGTPYVNTIECWTLLCAAGKFARYADLVQMEAIDDRRNPPPILPELQEASPLWLYRANDEPSLEDIDDEAMPEPPALHCSGATAQQPFAIELWAEKSTMNDILEPLAAHLGAVLVTGLGELSIAASYGCFERARQDPRPRRVLYCSDFDPAGASMPVAVARRLQHHAEGEGLDIRLEPVLLTAQQVEHYQLPRTPIKESERRARRFEERFGVGAVELDALEALHPGELRKIILAAAAPYFDAELARRTLDHVFDVSRQLSAITQDVHAQYEIELGAAAADWQAMHEAYAAAREQWRQRHTPTWQAIAGELVERIPPIEAAPGPRLPQQPPDPLFDSTRTYVEQTRRFKLHQGKGGRLAEFVE